MIGFERHVEKGARVTVPLAILPDPVTRIRPGKAERVAPLRWAVLSIITSPGALDLASFYSWGVLVESHVVSSIQFVAGCANEGGYSLGGC
jgi:hypothetical protein